MQVLSQCIPMAKIRFFYDKLRACLKSFLPIQKNMYFCILNEKKNIKLFNGDVKNSHIGT